MATTESPSLSQPPGQADLPVKSPPSQSAAPLAGPDVQPESLWHGAFNSSQMDTLPLAVADSRVMPTDPDLRLIPEWGPVPLVSAAVDGQVLSTASGG